MALDDCPTCERKFSSLVDYPLVLIKSFQRQEITSDIVFPYYDDTIFVGPLSECTNDNPPQPVLDYFRDNSNENSFEHEGWEWKLQRGWDKGNYHREQKDQREIIIRHLNPYLAQLESLVGKEVPTSQVLPRFSNNGYFRWAFDIPETGYNLAISNDDDNLTSAEVVVMGEGINLGSGGGPTLSDLVTVGKLEYEGRIRK